MDRLIEIKVGGNHLWKDSNLAGVQGEGNVTDLRITFNEGWSGYAKSITFFDAKGKNPVKRNLTADLLEDITKSTLVYLCKIPPEPLVHAGRCSFVIEGYVDAKRQRVVETEMEVQPARDTDDAAVPGAPTPSQAEQIQAQFEAIMDDVQKAAEGAQHAAQAEQYAAEAKASADAAEEARQAAEDSETLSADNAYRAEQAVSQIGTSVEDAAASAMAAARSAQRAASAESAASSYAYNAKTQADRAASAAKNAATDAAGQAANETGNKLRAEMSSLVNTASNAASRAEAAKVAAESAKQEAANSASSAEESAYIAELKKEETKSNAELAQSHATNAWGYMKTALESRTAAVEAQEAAEAAQAAAEKAASEATQAAGGDFATPAYVDGKAAQAESNAKKYTDEKLAEISVPGGGGGGQFEETDPTVPAWAKEASKPSYTASEVGADASGSAAKALTDANAYTDQKLSAIPTPDVSGQIGTHNTATDAHADIRQIAHNAASLATSAKSEAEAASQNAELAYDEAIGKASIFYCYEDSTELWEIDEQIDNGNIVILDQYGTHIPMTFADYGVTYVFRLLDGDRVITATIDSDGWTVHEQDAVTTDHASTETTYGKGSSSKYGHLKLSDATDSSSNAASGVAATPLAVKTAYALANSANTAATEAKSAASNALNTANSKADEYHTQAASTITAGTFAGQVVAKSDAQTPGTSLLRNSKIVSADTDPTVNGEINWTYG